MGRGGTGGGAITVCFWSAPNARLVHVEIVDGRPIVVGDRGCSHHGPNAYAATPSCPVTCAAITGAAVPGAAVTGAALGALAAGLGRKIHGPVETPALSLRYERYGSREASLSP